MKRNALKLGLLLLMAAAKLNGQNARPLLSGKIIDSAGRQPIQYATVTINDAGKPVKTTLSNDSGTWNIPLLSLGQYQLTVSAIGYTFKTIPFTIKDTLLPLQLDTILLATVFKALAAVTVTAQPPLIRQEIDRLAFDVQADPESKINSVLEMLRKVPLVTIDAEDNVQLKGSSNFRILINGKTSALLSGNIKDVLRTMPASTIEKIEVITIPPARYEAEGLAGIINIITSKKIDDGYKGTVNVYYRLPISSLGAGTTFAIKKRKWGFNFSGGYNLYRAPEQQTSNYRETTAPSAIYLRTTTRQLFDGSYNYAGLELSYAADSLQLLTAEFNTSNNKRNFTNLQASVLTAAQQQLLQQFQLTNEGSNLSDGLGAGINYQLCFKKQKSRMLTFSYRYTRSRGGQQNQLHIIEQFNYTIPDYRQTNQSRFTEQTLQADYTQPFKKTGSIEAGIKGIMRINESDFRYLSKDSSGEFTEVPAYSNTFNNTQSVWGFYSTVQYAFDNWNIKIGVRAEVTAVHADFISTPSAADQHYFNLIPSLSVQKKFKNNASLNMGFTQRIQRPGIGQLNPFVDRSIPNYESTGNPGLQPVLSNNMEIGFTRIRKTTMVSSLSYSFVNNNIQQAVIYQPNTKIIRSYYDNIGHDKILAANISINWPLSTKCNVTLSGTLGYQWFRGTIEGQPANNSGIKVSFRTSISYSFNKGWRLNENFNYYAPFINLQGTTSSYLNPSLSASKEIKRFTFSASAVNYFSTWFEYKQQTAAANFNQVMAYRYFNRSITVSINYKFGKLSKQLEKNKRGINNDDLQ